jgi:hypothetical protein
MAARLSAFGDLRRTMPFCLSLVTGLGCASHVQSVEAPDLRTSLQRKQSIPSAGETPPPVRLELSADEELIRDRLKKTAAELGALGERGQNRPWELADAAELIGKELSDMGASPTRHAREHEGVVYHSFFVELGGEGTPFEVLSFYDSGALGPALALELARIFVPARLLYPLRIVLSARPSLGAPLDEAYSGSRAAPLGRLVLGEGLGAPEVRLGWLSPEAPGERQAGEPWPSLLASALGEAPLAPNLVLGPALGSHPEPWSLELTASSNSPDNFGLAAVRVSKIRGFLGSLLGEKPSNDQMLTPL